MSQQISLEAQRDTLQSRIIDVQNQLQALGIQLANQLENTIGAGQQEIIKGQFGENITPLQQLLKQYQESLAYTNTLIQNQALYPQKTVIDQARQESRADTTPTIQLQGQTTENQSWLPLLLIGLGFLVLAN